MSVTLGLVGKTILTFGTEEQKREWLPELASGRKLAAFGLTEPGAGSDTRAARTAARLEDGEWIVDGSKVFITNAGADITAAPARGAATARPQPGPHPPAPRRPART